MGRQCLDVQCRHISLSHLFGVSAFQVVYRISLRDIGGWWHIAQTYAPNDMYSARVARYQGKADMTVAGGDIGAEVSCQKRGSASTTRRMWGWTLAEGGLPVCSPTYTFHYFR